MNKAIKICLGLILILAILFGAVYFNQSANLKVYVFDVGQGDSILIRTPTGENIVIDGGPDNSFIYKLGKTLPFYDQTIDLMILTHPHADHVVGLIPVLERYQVKQILFSQVEYSNAAYHEFLKLINEKKIVAIDARAGKLFTFNNVLLRILAPAKSLSGANFNSASATEKIGAINNLNDISVVVQLIYQNNSVLFMGDLEATGETELIQANSDILKSDVIKIGHHGSLTASSENFLHSVSPKQAIISLAKENDFGFPSPAVINRLQRLNIDSKLTSLSGDIIWQSNGSGFGFISR